MLAGALDKDRHLVGDLADVGFRTGEDGEAGALARGHHEQEAIGHLDDCLANLTTAEVPTRAASQRLETRGQRGQVLRVLPLQAPGGAQRQPVL
jgi:hypothetical protein